MAKLSTQFSIPAKVVTARLEHMKRNLNGIHKAIEAIGYPARSRQQKE